MIRVSTLQGQPPPVRGSARKPEPGAKTLDIAPVAQPRQAEDGLLERGQPPGAAARADPPALSREQPGEEPHQFHGDIERDTIGHRAEPSCMKLSLDKTSSIRGSAFYVAAVRDLPG
jgi:hypothetical protein